MNPADDDLEWLRALGGKPPERPDTAAAREAQWIRSAQLRHPQPSATDLQVTESDLLALIHRARSDDVRAAYAIAQEPPATSWWRRVWHGAAARPAWSGLVFAGVVAGLVAIPVAVLSPPAVDDPLTLRSPAAGVVVLESASPASARDQLATELRSAGIEVHAYSRLGRNGLDAELPDPVPAPVSRLLAAQGITAAPGILRVEFVAKP